MYNSVAAFTAEIVTMILGFVTPRIILVTYGSELNGLTSSILQFMSYFNLVEAGFSNAAVYALYKPFADKMKRPSAPWCPRRAECICAPGEFFARSWWDWP